MNKVMAASLTGVTFKCTGACVCVMGGWVGGCGCGCGCVNGWVGCVCVFQCACVLSWCGCTRTYIRMYMCVTPISAAGLRLMATGGLLGAALSGLYITATYLLKGSGGKTLYATY